MSFPSNARGQGNLISENLQNEKRVRLLAREMNLISGSNLAKGNYPSVKGQEGPTLNGSEPPKKKNEPGEQLWV